MKIYHILIAVTALTLLIGCASDDYMGVEGGNSTETVISFSGGTNHTTRATVGGREAAEKLNNRFVVYGFKTTGGNKQVVYDHYNVNYTDGTANTTLSNTAGWEYVNQAPNTLNAQLSGSSYTQDIKYWDMAADRYDFVAFSTGAATQQDVTGTAGNPGYPGTPEAEKVIITPVDNAHLTDAAYTITGATTDLTKVYIADRVTAQRSVTQTKPNLLYKYKDAIQFAFRPLAAKVRLGLYETIPGYSVKDVRFYQQRISAESVETPYLYAGTQTIPSGKGKVNVSFADVDPSNNNYNHAVATYDSEGEKTQSLTLGALTAATAAEQSEDGGSIYLGRTSSAASMTADIKVVPAPVSDLTLKIDFTLVSIDYNETIRVKGALATIPAQFTNWQPNYAYTYIFKISDMVANAFGQVLYPITFDALETVDNNGVQQTITTVDQPSITTYAKGELGNDYYVGDHIYVAVTNGTQKTLDKDNSKLYTVSTTLSDEQITENNISDGLAGITLDPVEDSFMTFTDHIDAPDSPTGDQINAISGSNFAKFTAGNYIYVFQYKVADDICFTQDEIDAAKDGDPAYGKTIRDIKTPAEYHYKVIRVSDPQRALAAKR